MKTPVTNLRPVSAGDGSSTSRVLTSDAGRIRLPPAEWDFSNVPEDELEACYYYEYTRAKDDVVNCAAWWQERLTDLHKAYNEDNPDDIKLTRGWINERFANRKSALNAYFLDLSQKTDPELAKMLLQSPGFPGTPWQGYSASVRKAISKSTRFRWPIVVSDPKRPNKTTRARTPPLSYYTFLVKECLGGIHQVKISQYLQDLRERRRCQPHGELIAFRIDWDGGVEKVIKDFDKWARKRFARIKKQNRVTPPEYHTWLRQLGVLRLSKAGHSLGEIVNLTLGTAHAKIYNDPPACSRAIIQARNRLNSLFPIIRRAGNNLP